MSFSKVKDRMSCNKKTRSDRDDKTWKVKACQGGKEKLIHFGDPSMRIRKSNPGARKSFRSRHRCDTEAVKGNKLGAAYWSCKEW